MIKYVAILKRADHLSREEFQRWWVEEHGPMASKIPGLRKYIVSLKVGEFGGETEWDGLSELWFDDEAAFRAAMLESQEAKDSMAETAKYVSKTCRFVTREYPIVGGTA